jgi:RHS repeat-associated protein
VGEEDAGMIWMESRHYDSHAGRFVEPDTIVANPKSTQGWARYVYVENDPVNYTDPTGHRRHRYGDAGWELGVNLAHGTPGDAFEAMVMGMTSDPTIFDQYYGVNLVGQGPRPTGGGAVSADVLYTIRYGWEEVEPGIRLAGKDKKGKTPPVAGQSVDTMRQKIADWAQKNLGKIFRRSDGEIDCAKYVDLAREHAGAADPREHGTGTDWGTQIPLSSVQRGDMLDFDVYEERVDVVEKYTTSDGTETTMPFSQTVNRNVHAAVVASSMAADGTVRIYEQNVRANPGDDGSARESTLRTRSLSPVTRSYSALVHNPTTRAMETAVVTRTETYSVRMRIRAYSPAAPGNN